MKTISSILSTYFTFEGCCPRGAFWGRQLALHLVFCAVASMYLCCQVATGAYSDAPLMFLNALFYLFSFPCGVLTFALYVAILFMGLMLCPPGYTPIQAPVEQQLWLYGGMLLAGVAMLALAIRNQALSARRLRDAGLQEGWSMLPLIPVLGHLVLMLLLCHRKSAGSTPLATHSPQSSNTQFYSQSRK